ncbi:MAG: hypothetical protein KJ069_15680 [Anaerolineae bacterium]|nr:hypothetical protein [Anaerolineae bacterium]
MTDNQPSRSLFLLGAPRLEQDGRSLPIGRRKVMALLAYLAMTNQVHSRDALAALLWPGSSPPRAYGSLRRCLSLARDTVGAAPLDITRQTVRFQWETAVWLAVAEFRRCLAAVQAHQHLPRDLCPDCLENLSRAAALYQGDFLAGFTLPDAPDFDEWQFWQRETLQRDCAWVLEQLAAYHAEQAQPKTAIAYARRWVHLDPLHEPAQQQLICLYLTWGQLAAAHRQYQCFRQHLAEELGTAPTAWTTALVEQHPGHDYLPE